MNDGLLEIAERPTSTEKTNFPYNLQQNIKQLHDSAHIGKTR